RPGGGEALRVGEAEGAAAEGAQMINQVGAVQRCATNRTPRQRAGGDDPGALADRSRRGQGDGLAGRRDVSAQRDVATGGDQAQSAGTGDRPGGGEALRVGEAEGAAAEGAQM